MMLRTFFNKSRIHDVESSVFPTIAAIDLGTNSCRLLVARVEGQSFRVIDSFSRVVRLGEGVQNTNQLTSEAIDRALDALRICYDKVVQNKVTKLRAVTTEASRRAENTDVLIRRARDEIGLDIEVISSEEEARLALAGCAGVLNTRTPYAVAFDIGGGSTEIMWFKINEPRRLHRRRYPVIEVIDCISLPYGVVTLSDRYNDAYSQDVYREIRNVVATMLKEFSARNNINEQLLKKRLQMVGTSGTVTTLAAIGLGLERYDRKLIDGVYMDIADVHQVSQKILNMSQEERCFHPCIGQGRADLVVMGTAILEGICDTWPMNRLRVADRGVREGILMDLVRGLFPKRNIQPRFIKNR